MKVVCTAIPLAPDGSRHSSPWVTVGVEYMVASLSASFARPLQLRLLLNDHNLGLFDADAFATVDRTIPASWVAQLSNCGTLQMGPAAWLVPGFWEAYYDDDPVAIEAVEAELRDLGCPPANRA